MNARDAITLIERAVGPLGSGGTWADIGAGGGTFTRALATLLGSNGLVYAVDRDAAAVQSLASRPERDAARVVPVHADFTRPLALPGLGAGGLDGLLLANALHFARDAAAVLARLAALVRPGGRVVLVEYDRRAASRWVPHPISVADLSALAAAAGLSEPVVTATRPSAYSGVLYTAAADRLAEASDAS